MKPRNQKTQTAIASSFHYRLWNSDINTLVRQTRSRNIFPSFSVLRRNNDRGKRLGSTLTAMRRHQTDFRFRKCQTGQPVSPFRIRSNRTVNSEFEFGMSSSALIQLPDSLRNNANLHVQGIQVGLLVLNRSGYSRVCCDRLFKKRFKSPQSLSLYTRLPILRFLRLSVQAHQCPDTFSADHSP